MKLIFTLTVLLFAGACLNLSAQTATNNGPASLPTRISNFNLRKDGALVRLTWNSDTEENVNRYEVERSADGRTFKSIGTVTAASQIRYSFADATPPAEAYYRIKALDTDGRIGLSAIIKFSSGNCAVVLNAFPNPCTGRFVLQHGATTAGSRVVVYAQDGRVMKAVASVAGTQQTTVDVAALRSGIYSVRFEPASGNPETVLLVKQ